MRKRPRDLNQWAKHMVDLATGNAQEPRRHRQIKTPPPHAPNAQGEPPMAAGVSKRLWEIGDIVEVLEAWEAVN
jgi:hypothetical protein